MRKRCHADYQFVAVLRTNGPIYGPTAVRRLTACYASLFVFAVCFGVDTLVSSEPRYFFDASSASKKATA